MKKLIYLTFALFCAMTTFAQEEFLYDFNNLTTGTQCLNGQDGWSTHYQTAGTSQDFDVDYTCGSILSPDESIAVFYPYGGPGVGRTATRKATDNFNFNFQNGGIIDMEFDMYMVWWGCYFGVGYDADGDGNVLCGMTEGDGGIFLQCKGSENNYSPNLSLPNGTSILATSFIQDGWARYKMSFDFSAFDGAGSVTVFVKSYSDESGWGEWSQISELTEVNMGLTPGSGDKMDYRVWDAIFFHCQGGTGGFDNLLVRQMPEGNMQYINMPDIPKQLVNNPPITLSASATSGLPVSFELIEGPATLNGNILTLTGETGTVTIKATQGGDDIWLPAPDVFKVFDVVDPMLYSPEITLRRPYDGSIVYMPEKRAMVLCLSTYIDHPDAIKFEEVKCTIDGEDVILMTDYPNDYDNGYFYGYWTPTSYGEYTMNVTITTSGGKVTTDQCKFTVTDEYDNLSVTTLNGDLICTPTIQSATGEYEMPMHVGAFNDITAHYDHNCVDGNCDTYDRVGGIRVRNYRGEWMELFRYISPFGVQCEDNVDVTDFTSILQGLVEFEFYFESWNGSGFNPTLTFELTKGTPDYLYADVKEIWYDTYPFGDYANQFPVPVANYFFDDNVVAAKLKLITTGHNWSSGTNNTNNTGNAAEFYHAIHNIYINDEVEFTQDLWRTCNPNPAGCQPQAGTWTYERSGWCPGSIAMVWDYDLTEHISDGNIEIFYQFDPTYLDLCHPNHPDCIDGQTCTQCAAPDNPLLRVSGKIVGYSNNVNILTSINNVIVDEDIYNIDIYPNPADKYINFSSDYETGKLSVLIINSQGQEVRNFTFCGSKQIDISDLASGVYFVKVLGSTMKTAKIIVK